MINVSVSGTAAVSAGFAAASIRSDAATRLVVRQYGALLKTRIMAKASGRPGPNAPTGDYRRSWTVRYFDGPAGVSAQVGTNKPQGRRLELGFVGTDSLGRTYNQAPYPHVGPAAQEIEVEFVKAIEGAVRKL